MDELCRNEVHELHRFFEDWFLGRLERTADNFARFTNAMAPDFEILLPDGSRLDLESLSGKIEAAHGSAPRHGRSLRIWIENYRGRTLAEGLHLATYEEWQDDGAQRRGRLSSALFKKAPKATGNVQWVHLHEVWLRDRNS